MIIDNTLFQRAGLADLPEPKLDAYREALIERLELAVGTRLVKRMSDEQLSELQRLKRGPRRNVLAWLHVNVPDYRLVVHEELERLTADLARQAADILALERSFEI